MMPFLFALGQFLVDHTDLVNALIEAVEGGATKADLMKAIRASMVAAADEQMKAELKP